MSEESRPTSRTPFTKRRTPSCTSSQDRPSSDYPLTVFQQMDTPMPAYLPPEPSPDPEGSSMSSITYSNELQVEGHPARSTDSLVSRATASNSGTSDDLENYIPPRASTSHDEESLRAKFKRLFDYTDGPGMLRCLFALFVFAVIIGIVVFNRSMHSGAPTSFPADDPRKGYTSAPPERGTVSIVSACFVTILTCVYSSVHPEVPYVEEETVQKADREEASGEKVEGEGEDANAVRRGPDIKRGEEVIGSGKRWWRRRTKAVAAWLTKLRRQIKSITIKKIIFSARKRMERIAAWLWRQIKSKKVIWVVFNIVAPELVAYVAVIEFLSARWRRKSMLRQLDVRGDKWTLAHQHFTNMGGFKVPVVGGGDVILRSGYDFYRWAYENKSAFLSINFKQAKIDIEGHSKADWLLKTYTIIQASWLVVQTIERAIDGLPVTELEVTSCAYVACALCTYIFWWHKPYGVQNHILLHVKPTPQPYWNQETTPTPFNRVGWNTAEILELPAVVVSGIIGAVIGAIHCTLWNAQFANTNGQLLWRVCCITQIVAPIVMSVFLALPEVLGWRYKWDSESKWRDKPLLVALVPCFFQFCARIVILILVGYSFWSQPADVYRVAEWSWSSFPHIS